MKAIVLIFTLILSSCNYLTETHNPTDYLMVSGIYNENFWGDKVNINGKITNSSKSVTFKDVVIKVSFLTKTNTVLYQENYTIYEYFPPLSEIPFELKVNNSKNIEKMSMEIINAKK